MAKALSWTIRCALELQDHRHASFVTLTFDEDHVPLTIHPRDLSGYIKRLRARVPDDKIRYFGCGEYGAHTFRPHYHALVFGLPPETILRHASVWRNGFLTATPVTPARIAYCAGYMTKKQHQRLYQEPQQCEIRVNPETLKRYEFRPSFNLMSRRPGIGASARQHWQSWRNHAIWHGRPVPLPRYLEEAFAAYADPTAIEDRDADRARHRLTMPHGEYHHESRVLADHTRHEHRESYRRDI